MAVVERGLHVVEGNVGNCEGTVVVGVNVGITVGLDGLYDKVGLIVEGLTVGDVGDPDGKYDGDFVGITVGDVGVAVGLAL